jgi:dTMP kinase
LHVIQPALKQGAVVLCDRFTDSTLAYQGYGRGLDLPYLRRANRFATGGLQPDLTLLFDLPVSSGLARRRRHGGEQNRIDRETARFHRSVRAGFLRLAASEPRRIRRIDARKDMDAVAQDVAALVTGFLRRRRHRPTGGFR